MKRILCFVICIMVLMSSTQGFAKAVDSVYFEKKPSIAYFTEDISSRELSSADVLAIDYENIECISEFAKQIIDNGTILFIASPEKSIEDISKILSIPIDVEQTYQPLPLMAYYFFKANEQYFSTPVYAALAEEVTTTNIETPSASAIGSAYSERDKTFVLYKFSDVTLLSDCNKNGSFHTTIDPFDAIPSAVTTRDDIDSFTKSVEESAVSKTADESTRTITMPSIGHTRAWPTVLHYFDSNGNIIGYMLCCVYAYAKGQAIVDDTMHNIYDVISTAKVYPYNGRKVQYYDVMMHCNVQGFIRLSTPTLPSGINYSQQLQLSGSYSSGSGAGGSVGYSTGWSYNPESQIVTETSNHPNVVYWRARTVNPVGGKAYDIAPGMRIASPINKMRGAFAEFYCDTLGGLFDNQVISTTIGSLGGWF